jgi:hypothetical protein
MGSSEQRDDWQPAPGFSSGSVPKPRSSVAKWRPSVRVGLDLRRVNNVAAKQRQKRRNIPCVKPNLGQSLKNATIVAPSVVAHPCQIITSICPGGSMCVFKWRSDSPPARRRPTGWRDWASPMCHRWERLEAEMHQSGNGGKAIAVPKCKGVCPRRLNPDLSTHLSSRLSSSLSATPRRELK